MAVAQMGHVPMQNLMCASCGHFARGIFASSPLNGVCNHEATLNQLEAIHLCVAGQMSQGTAQDSTD